MEHKTKLFPLLLAVLIVNSAGLLLKYFNFDPFIILIGFRFHISLIIPFFVIFRKDQLGFIKHIFVDPEHKRTVLPLLWILLPLILIIGVLFIINKMNPGDPDYFYEFGLSSIVDYPIYLVWNFPQLFAFFLFLVIAATTTNKKLTVTFLLTFSLFVFEFIPFELKNNNYINILSLLFLSISVGLLVKYFQNIYWLSIVVFSIFWLHFLAFGSQSEEIINLLFASQYSGWEGFFEVSKQLSNYLLPAQLLITVIVIYISALIRKRNSLRF